MFIRYICRHERGAWRVRRQGGDTWGWEGVTRTPTRGRYVGMGERDEDADKGGDTWEMGKRDEDADKGGYVGMGGRDEDADKGEIRGNGGA